MGIDVSVSAAVLIFVKATLFGAATMLPGGFAAMAAALVAQLIDVGATQPLAVSAAISIRVVTLWFGMLIGVISLIRVACSHEPLTVPIDQVTQDTVRSKTI